MTGARRLDIARRRVQDDLAAMEYLLAMVLVGMAEREFYVACSRNEDIDQVVETLQLVWTGSLRPRRRPTSRRVRRSTVSRQVQQASPVTADRC